MNEEPKSIWKKSWKGRGSFLGWLVLATGLAFVVSLLAVIILDQWQWRADWGIVIAGTVGGAIVALLFFFIRWLFCWRNFRRSLFGVACLATLIALFYAEEDWRGKHDWEKFKREWEAKGEKFNFADFVPLPVPDDQNFALTPIVISSYATCLDKNGHEIMPRNTNVVNRLLMAVDHNYDGGPPNGTGDWLTARTSDLKVWQNYYRTLAATTNEFPVAAQPQSPAADVLLALSKYDSAIEELRQANHLSDSRFPLDYDIDDPAEILLPHLAALKKTAEVLQLRAIAELELNQTEKASDDLNLIFRLTDSVRTEPFVITHLVRFSMTHIAFQPIWEGLAKHKWSDAQLVVLDAELGKLDFPANYEFSVRGERAADIKIVDYLEQKRSRYQQFFGLLYDGSDTRAVMNNFMATANICLAPKGWFYQNEIVLAQMNLQWNLPMVDAAHHIVSPKFALQAGRAAGVSMRATPFNFFNFFARLLLPSLGSFAQKAAYNQSSANFVRVAIALEHYRLAHGEFPESLDALVPQFIAKLPHDIINGQPLHYRRTSDGQFVLYSVGWNETDDGGVVGLTSNGQNADNRKGDWVWRYPSK